MTERPVGEAPRTEAGRALLDNPEMLLMSDGTEIFGINVGELELHIIAIEREAAAAPPEPPRPDNPGETWARLADFGRNKAIPGVAAPEGLSPRPLDSTKCECDCHAPPSSGESGSPPEPFDSQARDLLEACHERNIHSRGDMEYQFQPWAIDEDRLFEALSFLGEDDILADGSLWKVKEIALNAAVEYNRVGSGSPGEPE